MTRRRFYGMAAFLLVALVVAAIGSAQGIEQRLLLAGQAALASANIPYYDLEVRGRDAVVGGFIAEGTDIEALTATLRGVEGIRQVHLEGVIERVAGDGDEIRVADAPAASDGSHRESRARPQASTATVDAELRVHGAGCLIRIDGRVPADGFAEALHAAFAEVAPCGPVEASLWVNDSVRTAPWTTHPEALVTIVQALRGTYRVTAYGSTVRVFGAPRDDAAMDTIRAAADTMTGVDFGFVNLRPDPAGGAP